MYISQPPNDWDSYDAQPPHNRYSRQRNPFLHPWFRTGHETFDLIQLFSTRAFVIGIPLEAITRPRSLAPARSGLDISSGLHYAFQRVP